MLSKIYEMVIKIMSLLFLFSGLNFDLLAFLRLGVLRVQMPVSIGEPPVKQQGRDVLFYL